MNNLAINQDVYFDCVRKQLKYPSIKNTPYGKHHSYLNLDNEKIDMLLSEEIQVSY